MLNIKVKDMGDGVWAAKATLSGRGIQEAACDWCYAKTKKQALKTLKTRLKMELKVIEAAHYRVGACLQMVEEAIGNE